MVAPNGCIMIAGYSDPLDVLLNLQRALDSQTGSGWLQNQTASQGPFPPINVFQQGDDILAIIELPGVDKKDLQIQAKENTMSDGALQQRSAQQFAARRQLARQLLAR